MRKKMRKIVRLVLSRMIKIETLKVYDFDQKKEIDANYFIFLGKYIFTSYN